MRGSTSVSTTSPPCCTSALDNPPSYRVSNSFSHLAYTQHPCPCLLNPAHHPHSPWPCFFAQAVSSHRHCSSSESLPIHQLCSWYQPCPNTQEVVQPSSTSPSQQHLSGMRVTKCAATPAFLTSHGPLHSDSPHMLTAPQKETQIPVTHRMCFITVITKSSHILMVLIRN